jgi:hypothetical protein
MGKYEFVYWWLSANQSRLVLCFGIDLQHVHEHAADVNGVHDSLRISRSIDLI